MKKSLEPMVPRNLVMTSAYTRRTARTEAEGRGKKTK